MSLPSHARQAAMSPARRSKHRTTHRGRACPFKAGPLEARLVFCSGGPGGKASSAVAARVQGTVWVVKASRSETKRKLDLGCPSAVSAVFGPARLWKLGVGENLAANKPAKLKGVSGPCTPSLTQCSTTRTQIRASSAAALRAYGAGRIIDGNKRVAVQRNRSEPRVEPRGHQGHGRRAGPGRHPAAQVENRARAAVADPVALPERKIAPFGLVAISSTPTGPGQAHGRL